MTRRRARKSHRGLTIVETLVTTSIMTMFGGALFVMSNTATRLFVANTVYQEMEGQLTTANIQLKRDIWRAVDACNNTTALCPSVAWLGLDIAPVNTGSWGAGDIRYSLDATNPQNIRLVREICTNPGTWGPPKTMAYYINAPQTTVTINGTGLTAGGSGPLVTFSVTVRRNNPYQLFRAITNVRARLQAFH